VFGVTVAAGLVGLGASLARLVPAGTADGGGPDASLAGTALVGLAGSVAVRLGVVPLHRPQARLAGLAPAVTAPLVLVLAPAVFALAGLAAVAEGRAPSPGVERGLVVIVALAGVLLASIAALIHEDLEHVLGYAIAADGAVALLAIALPAAEQAAAWTWLLVMVAARSALAGWIVAVGGDDGGRRLGDTVGWARRRPLLGLALGAVAVATVGWPGSAAWEARATLAGGVGSSLALPVLVLTFLPALVHARLVAAGLQRPDPMAHTPPERSATRLRVATVAFVASAVLALAAGAGIVGMGGR
jgi:NADH:ubiquinone oxidoreductase subunit 2 (subunit N)